MDKIAFTKTDEAPALASQSLLPILESYLKQAGIELDIKDISLAGRIIALFPERLKEDQKQEDALKTLGELTQEPEANIIKLPNISASIPQLCRAIEELQEKGYNLPDFPSDPETDEEKEVRAKYSKVLGSAVNPVLREGNSDRRVAKPVKEFAKANPHSMGEWSKDSQTHVSSMESGDFYESEKSYTFSEDGHFKVILKTKEGKDVTLKEKVDVQKGEVVDSAFMSTNKLENYFLKNISETKDKDLLLSLHLKATMMKVSDPIMFGYAIKALLKDFMTKYKSSLEELGFDARNGLGDLYSKISELPEEEKEEMLTEIKKDLDQAPDLAMVNSDKGITNFHVPSDVIIDASMPAAIRSSGKMWNKNNELQDTKAMIPDRSYAGVYQATIDFCRENGAFDVKTMGNVSNIGLMAKKAEEYGSHDKTFWMEEAGTVHVFDHNDNVIMEQSVEKEDIFRMCQTKNIAIKDWVKLGVNRAQETGNPAVFWLDENRAHDNELIQKVQNELKNMNLDSSIEIKILAPKEATEYTLERVKAGKDTISVTGNVLRDYLTDLFPILELGTSAKMLSIVPLLSGGGLFETGAGGSAPKHVQQFVEENHLRWDSLGEFLALKESISYLAQKKNNSKAQVMADALDAANEKFLKEGRSPSRKVGELDNRGSHFYLSYYWAEALSAQDIDRNLKEIFTKVYQQMNEKFDQILSDLIDVQGRPVDIDGYYKPDTELVQKAMRPSTAFNEVLKNL